MPFGWNLEKVPRVLFLNFVAVVQGGREAAGTFGLWGAPLGWGQPV